MDFFKLLTLIQQQREDCIKSLLITAVESVDEISLRVKVARIQIYDEVLCILEHGELDGENSDKETNL